MWDYDEAERDAIYLKEHPKTDCTLYYDTAGEIEARDVSKRLGLDAEKRKNIRPDIDRTDVVFSDSNLNYSVVEPFFDNNGIYFENAILLDTDFFMDISPRNWGKKLREYVANRSKNNPFIMPIMDENGIIQQLQFAKLNERVEKQGGVSHKVINKLSSSNDNISKLAVVHIDEIVSVSEENNPYYTNEHTHQ